MTPRRPATTDGLVVLAEARWPVDGDPDRPPSLTGFARSSFSPLVMAVADRCLSAHYGAPPLDPEVGARTAMVLISRHGDTATAEAVATAVDSGGRVAPLLFFHSVPNAVLGHLAASWGLAGPLVCASPVGDARADGWALAELLIEDGAANSVLLILAEQGHAVGSDSATAFLLAPHSCWHRIPVGTAFLIAET